MVQSVLLLQPHSQHRPSWREAKDITGDVKVALSSQMVRDLLEKQIITKPGEYVVLVNYSDDTPESFFFSIVRDEPVLPPLRAVWQVYLIIDNMAQFDNRYEVGEWVEDLDLAAYLDERTKRGGTSSLVRGERTFIRAAKGGRSCVVIKAKAIQ